MKDRSHLILGDRTNVRQYAKAVKTARCDLAGLCILLQRKQNGFVTVDLDPTFLIFCQIIDLHLHIHCGKNDRIIYWDDHIFFCIDFIIHLIHS